MGGRVVEKADFGEPGTSRRIFWAKALSQMGSKYSRTMTREEIEEKLINTDKMTITIIAQLIDRWQNE